MGMCKDCGKYITLGHSQQRCAGCRDKFLKGYKKTYGIGYNKLYRKFKPPSAISGKYYQYYKFVTTLTNTEISVIIGQRKNDIRHTKDQYVIKVLRTYIKILCDVYDYNVIQDNEFPNKLKAYADDCEREDILRKGA